MKQYGLIGKTLTHSFSEKYFTEKFKKEGINDATYQLFELDDISKIKEFVADKPDLRGFNITIPYKESIIPYLDEMTEVVEEIGACNCVKIEDGKLIGYNTDVDGFMPTFLAVMEMHHDSAIVLGNGGAAKAVIYSLEQWSLDPLVVARNPKNENELPWNELTEEMVNQHKIIINTTPVGMYPKVNEYPDIPYEGIDRFHLVYDLIYNPEKTIFLEKAEKQDAVIKNGLEMLEQQADTAWIIWNS
ncbi:MAG: shikimate dehydrogenase [Bacteroidetes bacterium]|nr:MAG: shikimate dehydrogenase [Bacteroidota bacterium]